MKLKQSISKEFTNISSLDDFKKTISSLDNVFYGSLIFAILLLLIFLPKIVLLPIFYITVSYVGRLTQTILNFYKNKKQNEKTIADSSTAA